MVGRWCVATLGLTIFATALSAEVTATLPSGWRVILDDDHAIALSVQPHKGDAWTRLALRTTGKAGNWRVLAEMNAMQDRLSTDRPVRIPLPMARPEVQRQMLSTLFPADRVHAQGWEHTVVLGDRGEGESLWRIAEWFTGDGANYVMIKSASSSHRLLTRRGDVVLVPSALLSPHLKLTSTTRQIVDAEDDPQEGPASRNTAKQSKSVMSSGVSMIDMKTVGTGQPPALAYGDAAGHPVAVYRLKQGEALYSSVAIRFTGRVYARDVNEVVDQIVKFNGIGDVSKIPTGFPVQIPMELLLPEFRPRNDPRRLEEEESKRESSRVAKRVKAKDLKGVHVILDAGHGGRDVGTSHGDIWESDYVYDVVCRLKELLEKNTQATVWVTTRSEAIGYRVQKKNVLPRQTDHAVLTSPSYQLESPVVGVHLRWYLANSILSRLTKRSMAAEKVVFISIHADSLHPALRGAMAYVPGQRFVTGSFSKRDKIYLARAEVRESPTVRQTDDEALMAEGLSTEFAEMLMESISRSRLQVHPFKPIRDNVVRDGKEWVPAVIRYNKVPTRVLLEICNLGNEEDRKLVRTTTYRQAVAEAVGDALVRFFAQRQVPAPTLKLADKNRSAAK